MLSFQTDFQNFRWDVVFDSAFAEIDVFVNFWRMLVKIAEPN